ncbi:MAG: hypothetical protein Kilf2KO_26600 [Rhodospirillales bacterium]
MLKMIVMTAQQAAAVSGTSSPGAALEPRPLKDGRYAVNLGVCLDPAHASKQALLAAYPVEDVADSDFSEEE